MGPVFYTDSARFVASGISLSNALDAAALTMETWVASALNCISHDRLAHFAPSKEINTRPERASLATDTVVGKPEFFHS